jgi:putative ABC transport system permease protein
MPGAGPVARAIAGGLTHRKVQTLVIGLVLLVSTGACVLALGLVIDSSAPFDRAFAAQHGADVVATVDRAAATPGQLAATARLPEVTAAAGPYPEAMISPEVHGAGQGTATLPPMTVAGRGPGGPLDDLVIQRGRWAQRPGELVLSANFGFGVPLGTQLTVSGVPGTPRLTVVGYASSINDSADGWVVPSQVAALRRPGAPATAQMLYRFASAGDAAALRTDVGRLSAALPSGAVTGAQSYLTVKAQETSGISPIVPFVVAFGIIGLVMSPLIVINVVSGAVVSGYRRIGVLKSIGFTPAQVVASYAGLITVPAVAGCIGGVLLGNALSVPLLSRTATVYGVGALGVPAWADAGVPCAMCGLAGIAALLPALRAGRLSAVQAIATGRAPAAGRGYAAHRLLGRLPLSRPVSISLAAPFARPARAAVTLAAANPGLTPDMYDVALRPGTSPAAYVHALGKMLGPYADVSINDTDPFFFTLIGLIGTLTLLLAVVAGLGVLNTVLLHTRERAHDLGIFKAIGMTPRQTIAMVVCWVAGTGMVAGLLAVPVGMALHRYVLPVMAHAAGTGIPASYLAVYPAWEVAVLAVAGLVIAAAGGMLPAAWAARARTVAALHAE